MEAEDDADPRTFRNGEPPGRGQRRARPPASLDDDVEALGEFLDEPSATRLREGLLDAPVVPREAPRLHVEGFEGDDDVEGEEPEHHGALAEASQPTRGAKRLAE